MQLPNAKLPPYNNHWDPPEQLQERIPGKNSNCQWRLFTEKQVVGLLDDWFPPILQERENDAFSDWTFSATGT